jgi:hypothetical protein
LIFFQFNENPQLKNDDDKEELSSAKLQMPIDKTPATLNQLTVKIPLPF